MEKQTLLAKMQSCCFLLLVPKEKKNKTRATVYWFTNLHLPFTFKFIFCARCNLNYAHWYSISSVRTSLRHSSLLFLLILFIAFMFANLTIDNSFLADDASNICSYFDRNDFCNLNVSTLEVFFIWTLGTFEEICTIFMASCSHSIIPFLSLASQFKEAPPQYVHMDNYHLIHSSCSDKTGGGAAMFLRNSLKSAFLTISCHLAKILNVCS